MKKTAVLVGTMGGPKGLGDVAPFLFRLFNDKAILGVPQPLRCCLAGLITLMRFREARKNYAQIGGGSPILANTRAQAQALEEALNRRGDGLYKVFVGMSYSPPFIWEAVADIKKFDPDKMVLLPLYPQFSTTTTGSFLKEAQDVFRQERISCPIKTIDSFWANDGFLGAISENVQKMLGEESNPFVIFSAHGLPEKIVRRGDPYPVSCEKTARKLAEWIGLKEENWCLAYQSRVGPVRWIGPCLEEVVLDQSRAKRPLVVIPLSFVCEHVETIGELGVQVRQKAEEAGCPAYFLAPTVGCSPRFIEGLASII